MIYTPDMLSKTTRKHAIAHFDDDLQFSRLAEKLVKGKHDSEYCSSLHDKDMLFTIEADSMNEQSKLMDLFRTHPDKYIFNNHHTFTVQDDRLLDASTIYEIEKPSADNDLEVPLVRAHRSNALQMAFRYEDDESIVPGHLYIHTAYTTCKNFSYGIDEASFIHEPTGEDLYTRVLECKPLTDALMDMYGPQAPVICAMQSDPELYARIDHITDTPKQGKRIFTKPFEMNDRTYRITVTERGCEFQAGLMSDDGRMRWMRTSDTEKVTIEQKHPNLCQHLAELAQDLKVWRKGTPKDAPRTTRKPAERSHSRADERVKACTIPDIDVEMPSTSSQRAKSMNHEEGYPS